LIEVLCITVNGNMYKNVKLNAEFMNVGNKTHVLMI